MTGLSDEDLARAMLSYAEPWTRKCDDSRTTHELVRALLAEVERLRAAEVPRRMTPAQQNLLWDAINRYTSACGGDPSNHVYGNTARQRAVADVEAVIRAALRGETP